MENQKYVLKEPLQFGSELITELSFKPLKAKHLRGLTGKSGLDETLSIASRLSGLTDEQIDEMGVIDVMEVAKIVNGFLLPGQKTGSPSTPS